MTSPLCIYRAFIFVTAKTKCSCNFARNERLLRVFLVKTNAEQEEMSQRSQPVNLHDSKSQYRRGVCEHFSPILLSLRAKL